MKTLELDAEVGAVLPARDTMLVVSLAFVNSRVNANSALINITNRAAGNSFTGAAGATVAVSQSVTQNAINVL
jgi:hypothetical protein